MGLVGSVRLGWGSTSGVPACGWSSSFGAAFGLVGGVLVVLASLQGVCGAFWVGMGFSSVVTGKGLVISWACDLCAWWV